MDLSTEVKNDKLCNEEITDLIRWARYIDMWG